MIDRGRTMIKICSLRTPEAVAAVASRVPTWRASALDRQSEVREDLQQAEGL